MCMLRAKSADTYGIYNCLLITDVGFDQTLNIKDNEGQPHKYMLQGVVYFGSSHFVSHIVDDNLGSMMGLLQRENTSEKRYDGSSELHNSLVKYWPQSVPFLLCSL